MRGGSGVASCVVVRKRGDGGRHGSGGGGEKGDVALLCQRAGPGPRADPGGGALEPGQPRTDHELEERHERSKLEPLNLKYICGCGMG